MTDSDAAMLEFQMTRVVEMDLEAVPEQCPKCGNRHMDTGFGLFGLYARCQSCRTLFELGISDEPADSTRA